MESIKNILIIFILIIIFIDKNNILMNKIILLILLIICVEVYFFNINEIDINKSNKHIIDVYLLDGHFGDHIFNTYYLNGIKDYIEKNNIIINYYFEKKYHDEIKNFIQSKNIIIHDYKPIGLNLAITNIFFNNNLFFYYIKYFNKKYINYDDLYINIFNEISDILKIPVKFNNFIYSNPNLLIEYNKLPDKYKNLDVLIINSIPNSQQFTVDLNKWDNYINKILNKNLKIVTTKKIKGIICTLDDNLSLFQIGALSTRAKIIIAINTGPIATIFNTYTMSYVKKIFMFDNRITFSYDIIEHLNDIDNIEIENLKKILSSN
jgi:hypothetical protein